jgi:hypothetical protein
MMSNSRSIGLLVIGFALGAITTHSAAATQGQAPPAPPVHSRLVYSDGVTNNKVTGTAPFFIKDTKTSGCWFAMPGAGGLSIATAPTEACDFK